MSCPKCDSVKVIELKNEDFIDGIDNPTRRCEKCNFTWNNYEMSNVDNFVIGFCKKAMKVLEHNDVMISDSLRNSKYPDFYEKDYKGLGLFSICERDIQYIITSGLYRYYKIWPEYVGAYKNSQRLDIGLHYASEADSNGCIEPDVAIELKWAGFNKNGQLNSNSQQSLVDDVVKMKRNCIIENKYFMQVSINNNVGDLRSSDVMHEFEDKVNMSINKKQFQNNRLELKYYDYFITHGEDQSAKIKFNMLLWKIITQKKI